MSAREVLQLARENGIGFGMAGADLILEAEREPAPAVLRAIRRNKAGIIALLMPGTGGWSAQDWRAFHDERAGIAEFDGGLPRAEAEDVAFECCVAEWLSRSAAGWTPSRCLPCATTNPMPPYLETEGASDEHRAAEAVAALAKIGIHEGRQRP